VVRESGNSTIISENDRSENGDTLVEVLLALVVLGLASVALIIAFATSLSASAEHRSLATVNTVLATVSQEAIASIQEQPALFTTCYSSPAAAVAAYQVAVPQSVLSTAPYDGSSTPSFTAAVTSVEYWSASTSLFSITNPQCVANVSQEITVTITQASNGAKFSNSFVVNYPLATSSNNADANSGQTLVFENSTSVSGSAGLPLSGTNQPVVEVLDGNGDVAVTDSSPITLTIFPSTGQLSGCIGTENMGVVTFSGCTIASSGSYTLTASNGVLPPTAATLTATIAAGGNKLVFSNAQQPVGGPSGKVFATQPGVTVENQQGNTVSGSATITLTVSGGVLANCVAGANTTINAQSTTSVVVTTTNGVVSLTSCTFAGAIVFNAINGQLATPYTMTATASSLIPATSNNFQVSNYGDPAQLAFSVEPTGAAGSSLPATFAGSPQFSITSLDSFGNVISGGSPSVSLTISNGETLSGSGCNSPSTVNGALNYTGCTANIFANGVTLTATSGSLTVTSTPFNITGQASKLVFSTQPVAGASGTVFTTQPIITFEDSSSNTVTAAMSTSISLTSYFYGTNNLATPLTFCTSLAPSAGVVQVANCAFTGLVGTNYSLYASVVVGGTTIYGTSLPFTPSTYGAPTKLAFEVQPQGGPSQAPFTVQPVVWVEDSGGNVVLTSFAAISLGLQQSNGTLSSCTSLSAVTGVVNVSGCVFEGLVGTNYNLIVLSAGLTNATSSNFRPSGPGPASASVSTVSANPTKVVGNGVATSTITATLVDAVGNTIAGKTIALSAQNGSSVIAGSPATTNSNGTASFSVSDAVADPVMYLATDTTDSLAIVQMAAVAFISHPTVTVVGPTSRGQGAANQILTITGTGFVTGAVPTFSNPGITVNSTTFTSSTTLSVTVSIASGAATGPGTITVTNPDTGAATSGAIFTVNVHPTVTVVSPTSRDQGAANQILTVTGTGFVTGAVPTFSNPGITVNSTTFTSSTTLSVTISIASGAATGPGTITVTNPDAGYGTSGAIFTVNAAPTVTAVGPASLDQGAANQVLTVTGTNFDTGASLAATFSNPGIAVNSTTFTNSTTLSVNVSISGSAATGLSNITVTNGDGTISTGVGLFTVNAAPTVAAVSPVSRGEGAANQLLTVTGTNFDTGASLAATFSNTGITVNSTTFTNSTTLSVNISIASAATTGVGNIVITNGDGTSAIGVGLFAVNPHPTATAVSPTSRGQGAASQTLTLTGAGFVNGAVASFSNPGIVVNSTTFTNSTTLSLNVSVTTSAATGSGTITVTNPDGGVGISGSIFTVNVGPTVTTVNPTSLGQGAINQVLTLRGTGFVTGAAASFSNGNITVISTTFTNSTTLSVNISIASGASTGAGVISVTNPDGGDGTSAAIFTVNVGPTVTTVNPTSLGQGAINQVLTLRGTGFVTGAAASFSNGNITVISTTFTNSTTLSVHVTIANNATLGPGTITVTNPDGGAGTSGSIFTVNVGPAVTGVNPNTEAEYRHRQVTATLTVTGTGFVNGAVASFSDGDITVNSTTFTNSTTLSVNISIAAGAAAGSSMITVTNPDGGAGTSGSIFTVT
jgi:hypothetical protein